MIQLLFISLFRFIIFINLSVENVVFMSAVREVFCTGEVDSALSDT